MRRSLPLLLVTVSLSLVATAGALETGTRAPAIQGTDLAGNALSSAALRGKVVVLDFWASWCDPCREAMPALERLHQRYRERGVVVLGVSVDRSASNAQRFLQRTPVSFRVMHDDGQSIARRYRPETMPSTYVIDRGGVLRHVQAGYHEGDEQAIERAVRAAL